MNCKTTTITSLSNRDPKKTGSMVREISSKKAVRTTSQKIRIVVSIPILAYGVLLLSSVPAGIEWLIATGLLAAGGVLLFKGLRK